MNSIVAALLLGCQQQADDNIKAKINFVPNEDYVGDPHPVVKEEMKLTNEEKLEFEKVKQEVSSNKEGE
ncbi:hypothetical protein QNH39_14055 [Neobacillus novalis]|uniref:Uncharacterized protein n=2 Tax=Neobacillus novalis TaxID=220687 RepID=A0AA95SJN6_9BACI|nr:hypothetical protein [Neobacillus novalis]WHY88886.1 hypothetical protein QNH39_14055 [Neobacillus novalis]